MVFSEIMRFVSFRAAPVGDFRWVGTPKVAIQGYGNVDVAIDSLAWRGILWLYVVAFCKDFRKLRDKADEIREG